METVTCPSPAKLNLFLHITGQREDGYHLIQTVFQLIDYCDEIVFTANSSNSIQLHSAVNNLSIEQNLIYKAAMLLKAVTKTTAGAEITLHKKIPLGGGLGGGSSNAATTLLALNKLWNLKLSLNDLKQLGLQLGADVPVFVYGKNAWGEGIGEKLSPMLLPEAWYLIIIPPCHISTAKVFSDAELKRDSLVIGIEEFYEGNVKNDCEVVVKKLYSDVATALDWLNQYTRAYLTGTGACIFGKFLKRQEAESVLSLLPKHFSGFVVKSLPCSPLHQLLGYR